MRHGITTCPRSFEQCSVLDRFSLHTLMCLYVELEQAIAEGEASVTGKDGTAGPEARLFVISR